MFGVHVDVFTDHKSPICVYPKVLNLWQRRWLQFYKEYDMSVFDHSSKTNVEADALSRMTMGSLSHIDEAKKDLAKEVYTCDILEERFEDSSDGSFMVGKNSKTSLIVEVKFKQHLDKSLMEFKDSLLAKLSETFFLVNGILR